MACPERSRRDPQIGRFLGVDPLAAGTFSLSPYMAMNNDPANMMDPLGLQSRGFYLDYRNGDGVVYDFMEEHMSKFSESFRQSMGWFGRSNVFANAFGEGLNGVTKTYEGENAKRMWAELLGQKYPPEGTVTSGALVRITPEEFHAAEGAAKSNTSSSAGDGDIEAAVALSLVGRQAVVTTLEVSLEVTAPAVGAGLMTIAAIGALPTTAHAPTAIHYTTTNVNSGAVDKVFSLNSKIADEILQGEFKRSPSYKPKYGNKTREELDKMGKFGDQSAKKMKKLVDQVDRLLEKSNKK